MHDNADYDNPDWWRRIGERWGVEMLIRMAQRVAEKRAHGPNVIYNYTEWRASRYAMPPGGTSHPTMSDYEVTWL